MNRVIVRSRPGNGVTVTSTPTSVDVAAGAPLPAAEAGMISAGHVHTQVTEAAEWIINHNLGRPVGVAVRVGGRQCLAAVTHPTLNQARVSLITPAVGFAVAG